ncbi:golgin subfamily A member 5-like [Polyodon spathula]|uniref:golgin subfamily A member 5-like n=1 Tax=Polyodon spathula TaxID=7913 RepID=UPI001B7F3709|nr:golgin subfamily A member 5-like [Polyodon spathula]XP_041122660.1 golgin subfamily A member 5-like [Polyodon spathula]XP_041122661.1 golgin subfamily A member 5-like [Polyodon spathula]
MSWFTDLAGKAENFLNKVDQGAATVLSKQQAEMAGLAYDTTDSSQYISAYKQQAPEYHPPPEVPNFITSAAVNIKKQKATLLSGTANVSSASQTPEVNDRPPSRPSSHFVRPKKTEPDDDLLFDFLNSSDKTLNGKVDSTKEKPKTLSCQSLSRTSSLSSISTGTHSNKTSEDGSSKDGQGQDTPESSDSGLVAPSEPAKEVSASVGSSLSVKDESQSQVLSNLRLENQLLRNEVSSLNQEMASLIQRSREMQEELSKARARVERWNADHSKSDQTVRQMRSQVDDLTEVISAKDAQLAVLKVRLDEADQLLKSRTEALESAQCERSRIIQDCNEGSSLHDQTLQALQERLREADSALKREQESYRQIQSEYAARLSKVEAERQSLAESLTVAERKSMEEKRRAEELQQQLKFAKAGTESVKQELIDYKQKATRILQSKEKLISSLKEGAEIDGLDSHTASTMELEELRHERDMQREEIQKLMGQFQQLRTELQDTENLLMTEGESSREQLQELQDQITSQKRSKQEAEAELERQKQAFQYLEEELHRTKNSLQSRIKDREEEVQKLRNQLTNRTLSNSSQTELENRLHQLTETLIQKQTMLEALGTEKNSLVFQLEHLEQQLKSVEGSSTVNGSSINMAGIENTEGARMRNVPVLFSDGESTNAGMYGRVRNAASTIDRFSIRLGIFLRRYPIARVFVIIYMAILHLWVMIVLLTYTPEMHPGNPDGKMGK